MRIFLRGIHRHRPIILACYENGTFPRLRNDVAAHYRHYRTQWSAFLAAVAFIRRCYQWADIWSERKSSLKITAILPTVIYSSWQVIVFVHRGSLSFLTIASWEYHHHGGGYILEARRLRYLSPFADGEHWITDYFISLRISAWIILPRR